MHTKILVVDDDPITRELFRSLLKDVGEVIEARDGYEALALVHRHFFSLVLLDVSMPGVGGQEVAALLRKNPHTSSLPIVFITATAPAAGATAEDALGAADLLLTKPVEPELLRALCRTLLRLYTAKQQAEAEVQFMRAEMRELRPASPTWQR
jgi:putative two-component system response regulator